LLDIITKQKASALELEFKIVQEEYRECRAELSAVKP
jgi:hypothetical protein